MGNERRIQRLAARDRGGKQWRHRRDGVERRDRHTRQGRVRWGTLRLGRVGTARTETKRTGAGTASEDHAQVSAPAPGWPPGLCALEADSESPGSSCVPLHRSLPHDEGTLFCQAGRMNHQRQCAWDRAPGLRVCRSVCNRGPDGVTLHVTPTLLSEQNAQLASRLRGFRKLSQERGVIWALT